MTLAAADPNAVVETARRTGNRGWRRFRRHKLAMVGVACILLLVLACVAGPWLLPFDDLRIDMRARFAPPLTGLHLFGTDPLGRDLCARLLMAGRISLAVAFSAPAVQQRVTLDDLALEGAVQPRIQVLHRREEPVERAGVDELFVGVRDGRDAQQLTEAGDRGGGTRLGDRQVGHPPEPRGRPLGSPP